MQYSASRRRWRSMRGCSGMNHAENAIAMYHQIFLVSAVLAVLCLMLAVVMFFVFRIPGTIGYLSGKTAKRSIEKMKQGGFSSSAGQAPAAPGTGRSAPAAQAVRGRETLPLGRRNMPEYAGGSETLPLGNDGFQIEEEILVTHTDETI